MTVQDTRDCIDVCIECARTCTETIGHCLTQGGKHALPKHIRLLNECAAICGTSAKFMLLGSENHALTCGVCAEICAQCAEECEEFPEDPVMVRCAEVCRRCEEECLKMAELSPA